jgi:hypothetical protein
MGRKCDDVFTAPLCWECHQQWHQMRRLGSRDASESMEVQILAQRDAMADFVRDKLLPDSEATPAAGTKVSETEYRLTTSMLPPADGGSDDVF